MSNIKVGDLVRVISVDGSDKRLGVVLNRVYEVGAIDPDGDIYPLGTFKDADGGIRVATEELFDGYSGRQHLPTIVLYKRQVELVRKSEEYSPKDHADYPPLR